MIYFVQNKARNAVKIGFSENLEARLKVLQTVSLDPLELIGTIEGDRDAEKELHKKFKDFKIRGEWFLMDSELKDFVRDYVAPLAILGVEIKSFYLAGKLEKLDWRDRLINEWSEGFGSINPEKESNNWNDKKVFLTITRGDREFKIQYTGPFRISKNEGFSEDAPHMYHDEVVDLCGKYSKIDHAAVAINCVSALSKSDLVFAWIDSRDCFGTLVEIGYASAFKDKVVVVATPEFDRELWFACAIADRFIVAPTPVRAWNLMWANDKNSDFEVKNELIGDDIEDEDYDQDESENDTCDVA